MSAFSMYMYTHVHVLLYCRVVCQHYCVMVCLYDCITNTWPYFNHQDPGVKWKAQDLFLHHIALIILLTTCFIFTIGLKLPDMAKQTNETVQLLRCTSESTVEKTAYLHIFDAQTLKTKPQNEAIIVRDACDKSFHSVVTPAVQHLSQSNCYNCALKLVLQTACLNINKIFSKQQNHSRAKSQAAVFWQVHDECPHTCALVYN